MIRVLTVNSKTFYFNDKGTLRGSVVDFFRLYEDGLNKKLARREEAQGQEPEGAGGLHPDAARPAPAGPGRREGRRRRRQHHDHAGAPEAGGFQRGGHEQRERGCRYGPGSPKIATVDDLAGKEVFVRKSSSYYESLVALNKKFAAEKKAADHAQGGARDARGRGPARDAQRRAGRDRHRRQAQGGLLEAGLPEAHRPRPGRRSHRRRGRLGVPQGEPAAQGFAGRFRREATRSGPRPATSC